MAVVEEERDDELAESRRVLGNEMYMLFDGGGFAKMLCWWSRCANSPVKYAVQANCKVKVNDSEGIMSNCPRGKSFYTPRSSL